MIELKNIVKTYRSKKGKNTLALNNVSLKFNNKGMVFILGKSGSGKSTLLNILGGLDKYDNGDMLILGKSSKNFTQADFDSYRNTYVGFVFQEFNILEDYNVYENILLALQLQQKKVDNNKIEELLEKLEIKDLKDRKVNELSGGQKQRVAIARALIKKPKIILADEPTGNLDSKTSRDVMNLLKEISKEKLVVIVSHDNESAKLYADRIIEIKDGNVINDVDNGLNSTNVNDSYLTIKSSLPIKESFKLGLGSLRHKKIKLFFTIFLTICTLLFLSLTDTLSSYDVEKAHSKLLKEKNEDFVQIEKYRYYNSDDSDFVNKDQLKLTEEDSNIIKNKVDQKLYEVYKIKDNAFSYGNVYELLKINFIFDPDNIYYMQIQDSDIVVTNELSKIVSKEIIGRAPEKSNEIVISNYIADQIIDKGIEVYEKEVDEFMEESTYQPKSYEELLNSNKTFYFGKKGKVKIVGIINYDIEKYKVLMNKNSTNLTTEEEELYTELWHVAENVYSKIYVNDQFLSALDIEEIDSLDGMNQYRIKSQDFSLNSFGYYIQSSILNEEVEYFDGTNWKKIRELPKKTMLLNVKNLEDIDYEKYEKSLDAYLKKHPGENVQDLEKKFFENYIKDFDIIGKKITFQVFEGRNFNVEKPTKEYEGIEVIGLVGYQTDDQKNTHYFSNEDLEEYKTEAIAKTAYLIPEKNENALKDLLTEFKYNEELSVKSTYSGQVVSLVRTVSILRKIGFYVGIVLLVFAVFLIGNFVFSSINYRKKEIGVLRSLGARSIDVVKIFLWEGLIMSLISVAVTSGLLILTSSLLNDIIMTGTSIILTPFIVGIRQFVIIFLLVFIVTIISSIIPIQRISKMKPIDAILKK